VAEWLREAKKNSNPHMVIILVGNKADLEHKRAVRLVLLTFRPRHPSFSFKHTLLLRSFAEGERFAKANDLLFLEASAKTGDYVEETMVTAAINVLERLNNGLFRMDDEVSALTGHIQLLSSVRLFIIITPFLTRTSTSQTHGIRLGVKAPQKSSGGCC